MHSCVTNRLHVVFGTKYHLRALSPSIRERLFPYVVATAKNFDIEVLEVGGVEDHVHMLIALPATMTLSDAMKKIKANTSRWIIDTFGLRKFAWQQGYGAFSVGISALEPTRRYIAGQVEHHRRRDFRGEMEQIFRQHGIEPSTVEWWESGSGK